MNKFKSLLTCLFFIASAISFINGCTQPNKMNNTQKGLTLKIQSNKEIYREREKIQIALEVINNSNQPIKLPPGIRSDFSLCLRKSDGNVFPFWQFGIEIAKESSSSWKILNPGETAKTTMVLEDLSSAKFAFKTPKLVYQKLPPPDTYTIYATYAFDKEKAEVYGVSIDKADESSIWFGKVTSNTIKITVKPN